MTGDNLIIVEPVPEPNGGRWTPVVGRETLNFLSAVVPEGSPGQRTRGCRFDYCQERPTKRRRRPRNGPCRRLHTEREDDVVRDCDHPRSR